MTKSLNARILVLSSLPVPSQLDWIGPKSLNLFSHLLGNLDKAGGLTRRQVIHLDALSPDPDGFKNLFGLFDSFSGPNIPSVVMTFTFEAAGNIDPISSLLKCPEYMNKIHLAGTGDEYDPDVARVRKSHRTCQVRSRVPSILATKCDDYGLKLFHQRTPSSKASTLLKT